MTNYKVMDETASNLLDKTPQPFDEEMVEKMKEEEKA